MQVVEGSDADAVHELLDPGRAIQRRPPDDLVLGHWWSTVLTRSDAASDRAARSRALDLHYACVVYHNSRQPRGRELRVPTSACPIHPCRLARRGPAAGRIGLRRRRRQRRATAGPARSTRPPRCASATSRTSPTPPALVGVEKGIFEETLGDDVTLETADLQRRPRGRRGALRRRPRRHLHRPQPGHQRLRQVRAARRSASSPAPPRAARSSSSSPRSPTRRGPRRARSSPRPQLGNTQDVALRAWLKEQGPRDRRRGRRRRHRSSRRRTPRPSTPFKAGDIDGAWVPEPWATRLDPGGRRQGAVDERDLWPDGEFVTTHLIVRTEFLDEHPDVVKQLLEGQVAAIDVRQRRRRPRPRPLVNAGIEEITGKPLAGRGHRRRLGEPDVHPRPDRLARCRSRPTTPRRSGCSTPVDLDGIYDLDPAQRGPRPTPASRQ